jgi:hypothetical protein
MIGAMKFLDGKSILSVDSGTASCTIRIRPDVLVESFEVFSGVLR